jgi:hypothetical protein
MECSSNNRKKLCRCHYRILRSDMGWAVPPATRLVSATPFRL